MRPAHRRCALFILAVTVCAPSCGCYIPNRFALRDTIGKGCEATSEVNPRVAGLYVLRCRDVIEVRIAECEPGVLVAAVQPDGSLPLGPIRVFAAEGLTAADLESRIANMLGLPPGRVRARVTNYRGGRIHVFGLVRGRPRAIDYRGPETVIDLLRRVGGIDDGAALNEIHVVRPNVAAGSPPQVFAIDVEAIILRKDGRTNLRLRPGDQVHIGETNRSAIVRLFPDWLRPALNTICLFCPSGNAIMRRP